MCVCVCIYERWLSIHNWITKLQAKKYQTWRDWQLASYNSEYNHIVIVQKLFVLKYDKIVIDEKADAD